jgi:protease II
MTSGELVWASDNSHLLYTVKDELDRPYKVLLHVIGANKTDEVVFEEQDEVSSSSSSDGGNSLFSRQQQRRQQRQQ